MAGFTMTAGGVNTLLNISAPSVVKAAGGNIVIITISGAPTAGFLTINDCATTGAATAANQIVSIPFGSLTQAVINMNWFLTFNGITVSAIPTGTTIAISYA